ncbi:hypothetical protein DPX16_22531 [Anabarilius grahami]|uniref:Uncharacterized protein n=1 Tax=Anabarilius grahami TaxID=495550 RepID=A0A3N0YYR0_ANAGA|nr:hypothetical protein DPX16_22531 [Anabarilius grahami]
MARRPTGGGRQCLFTQQQELAIVNLVRANNAIRLHQLQQQILADRQVFNNINRVSITTIRRILVKHNMTMKQLYRVPFERNSVRVKELRHEYVQLYHGQGHGQLVAQISSETPCLLAPRPHPLPPPSPLPPLLTALAHPHPPPLWCPRPFQSRLSGSIVPKLNELTLALLSLY